jgi:hypothetical protein
MGGRNSGGSIVVTAGGTVSTGGVGAAGNGAGGNFGATPSETSATMRSCRSLCTIGSCSKLATDEQRLMDAAMQRARPKRLWNFFSPRTSSRAASKWP